MVYFVLLIFLVMHWNACLFSLIGNMAINTATDTWFEVTGDEKHLCASGMCGCVRVWVRVWVGAC